jgi:hypothetical protein
MQDGDLLSSGRLHYLQSSGWDLEAVTSSEALAPSFLPPYDAIHVGAAAREIPRALLLALKVNILHFIVEFIDDSIMSFTVIVCNQSIGCVHIHFY